MARHVPSEWMSRPTRRHHASAEQLIATGRILQLRCRQIRDLCAEGGLVTTSKLRGGAGSGWASCIGGATFNHRNSITPLKLMQVGGK
ncbi:hypothetical protein PUN28_012985 [Cardiocondyla obscurior]|uniref:Uncharacterized protein n=1 Tax=Cardiocondyla obscurior TaxID=286306 RepID=A0AAW2FAA6_9HYME